MENYENKGIENGVIHYISNLYPEAKIPVPEHFWYYMNQLALSPQFTHLPEKAYLISDMLTNKGESGEFGLRMTAYKRQITNSFLKLWEENDWANELNEIVVPKSDFQGNSFKDENTNGLFISIDVVSANFSTCNYYLNFGVSNWTEFYHKYLPDMHEALVESKSFRQYLFGNTNPKRIQNLTKDALKKYILALVKHFPKHADRICMLTNDEITLKVDDFGEINGILADLMAIKEYCVLPLKFTVYESKTIANEGVGAKVDKIFELIDNKVDEKYLSWTHKHLKGVRGDRFHLNFKKHVLGLTLDSRDLKFMVDGHQATWQY